MRTISDVQQQQPQQQPPVSAASFLPRRAVLFSGALALLGGLALSGPLAAQEPKQKYGFIRLVNAVAQGAGKVSLVIDGTDMSPDGYEFGDVTGGMGLKPGAHTVTVKRDGVKEGTTKVNVAADDTTTVIPFAEKVPASDEKPAYWSIRILRLKQKEPEKDRTATFVSVANEPEIQVELSDPEGKWSTASVKRLSTAELPLKFPEGYAPIRTKAGKLESIPIGGNGNYVTVLYSDPEGKLRSLNFRDFKFLTAD